ncbi:MAG: metallophosphoesterase [Desulfurococcales archaeon]|nr:metallophosphoesterase [Desulfurococcales archaeon]
MGSDVGLEMLKDIVMLRGIPAIFIRRANAVVIADLHLGYEESMARQGVYLPRLQIRKALRVIRKAKEITGAKKLIINGDIKHEFGRLLKSEKLEVAKFLRGAYETGYSEVILVRGNHDNYVKPIIESLGGEVVEELVEGDVLLTHGHKKVRGSHGVIVIGHEHPSISVSISGVKARFPIFLLVPLEDDSMVLVLPAAGAYQTGNPVSVIRENYLSPIIREKGVVSEAVPIIVDETEGLMPLPKISLLESLI